MSRPFPAAVGFAAHCQIFSAIFNASFDRAPCFIFGFFFLRILSGDPRRSMAWSPSYEAGRPQKIREVVDAIRQHAGPAPGYKALS